VDIAQTPFNTLDNKHISEQIAFSSLILCAIVPDMKNILFGLMHHFIRVMIVVFLGISTSSCTAQINIPDITAEAKTTFLNMDEIERSKFYLGDERLQAEDITEGVIVLSFFIRDSIKLIGLQTR